MTRCPGPAFATMMTALLFSFLAAGTAPASETYHLASNAGFSGYVTTNEQRRVILACRGDLGMRGPATFKAVFPDNPPGGQTLLRIAPDQRLSASDESRINACADRVMGRQSAQPDRVERQAAPRCFDRGPVLVGGSTYCIRGN